MGKAASPELPRSTNGSILWENVAGFREWARVHLRDLTNGEAMDAIETRYGVRLRKGTLDNLRRRYDGMMAVEARRRALDVRNAHEQQMLGKEKAPVDPIKAMDQQLLREQVKRLTRKQTFYELMGGQIITAIRTMPALPPIKPPTIRTSKLTEEEAVLVISDVQAGLTTSARESGGLGEFNTQILLQQIEYLLGSLTTIRKYHPNVRRLHIVFNGDIIEGQTIFFGQAREVDMNVIQQIFFCVEHFARLIRALAAQYAEVYCTGVVGNHGRIGMKGELSPLTNMDYLVYKWLEERTRDVAHIKWSVPETWWTVIEVLGWRFLCVHGDDTGSGTWGIPFYGMARHKHRYRELLKVAGHTNENLPPDFEFVILGHHSEAAQFQNVIAAGSWPGGTEFSLKRMQAAGIPSAPFFGVARRHGVTWRRDVQLRPIRPPSIS